MRHRANPRFWSCYHALDPEIRRVADHCYQTLLDDSRPPSLHFKKVGRFWSVRVGIHDRALAVEDVADLVWFWIGPHAEYDRLIGSS